MSAARPNMLVISAADRINPVPPRAAVLPLSQPDDEVQIHFLADKPEFVAACAGVCFSEWNTIYKDFYDIHTVEAAIEWMKRDQLNRDTLNTCFVATVNGEFACTAQLCTEDVPPGHAYYGTTPWLTCMYTAPEFRGRGVASKMLTRLLARTEEWGYRHLYLITQHMQQVYERFGFRSIETIEIYDHPYTVMRRDFPIAGKQVPTYTEQDAKASHKIIHADH